MSSSFPSSPFFLLHNQTTGSRCGCRRAVKKKKKWDAGTHQEILFSAFFLLNLKKKKRNSITTKNSMWLIVDVKKT
jgi:hypothetical protein